MGYRLKIGPSQGLKLKGGAGFGLPMIGGTGIKATKSGGIWTVELDYSELTPGPVSDATTAYVAIEDKTAGIYREVSLASLLTSGLDADLQAIAALTSTGILVRTADDTWALRTLTGTANEITVTNGDGVSDNPTVSLPDALTFTDKTVTGGTFDGVTITTSTFNGNTWTAGTGTLTLGAGKTATISNTLTFTGTDASSVAFGAGGTVAYTGSTLAQFAATTSAQLAGVVSDETGSGALVFATSPSLITPDLDTPSAVVLTNGTGLPITTGVSGLASGIATFLNSPSSAHLKSAITDETGNGFLVFATSPNLITPNLGTPSACVATNLTGTAAGLTAGNVTTNANLTGDVTSVGNATTIAANAVTNAKLATAADGTIKSNISGGTATPSDNTITAVLDKLFGTTQGSVIYRGASSWGVLTPGTSGDFLKTQGASANPVWDSIPGGGDMLSTNNLSDVANATTARTNLSAAKSGANSDITSLSGLTTPLSTAQGGTGDTGSAWTQTTPTVTASSGTFTSVSCVFRYKTIGKSVSFIATVTITNAGTATGNIIFTLPFTPNQTTAGGGKESAAVGYQLNWSTSAAQIFITKYDNTSIIGSGRTCIITGVVEIA